MITGLYAGVLALLFVALSLKVIKLRIKHQVGIGDNGHQDLALAIRVQGNFAEYIPMSLLLLAIAEINGAPNHFIHGFGVLVILSRLSHAKGLYLTAGSTVTRKAGTAGIFLALIGLSVLNIVLYLF